MHDVLAMTVSLTIVEAISFYWLQSELLHAIDAKMVPFGRLQVNA
jgi:hypothetical protein